MRPSDLKAYVETTREFAAQPDVIGGSNLPYWATSRSYSGCPFGLRKVTVLEVDVTWDEVIALPKCLDGVKTPAVVKPRKNGVLVEFEIDPRDARKYRKQRDTTVRRMTDGDDVKYVAQVITDKRLIFGPWSAYEPIHKQRVEADRAAQERHAKLEAAVADLEEAGIKPLSYSYDSTRYGDNGKRLDKPRYQGWVKLTLEDVKELLNSYTEGNL